MRLVQVASVVVRAELAAEEKKLSQKLVPWYRPYKSELTQSKPLEYPSTITEYVVKH